MNELEIAGMRTPNSRIGNPIPPGLVLLPEEVELEDERVIRWHGPRLETLKPPDDLIQEFQALFNARPDKIAAFCSRYGVLGMDANAQLPKEPNFVSGIEFIEQWRSLASRVRSILRLAGLLSGGQTVGPENIAGEPSPRCPNHGIAMAATWGTPELRYACPIPDCSDQQPYAGFGPISEHLAMTLRTDTRPGTDPPGPNEYFWLGQPFPKNKKATIAIARRCLDLELQGWLHAFPSTIDIERNSSEIELRLNHRYGLLSVIALQMMQAAARKAVYFCSECKNPFVRFGGSNLERRPRRDRDRFCDQCGRAAALRRADRRRNERMARARELHAGGMPLAEIAATIGARNVATVRRWIKKGK